MDRKYSRLLCRAIPNSSITCPPSPAIMHLRRVRFSNGATNLYWVRLYTAQYAPFTPITKADRRPVREFSQMKLYTFFRSSASYRVRIALNLKSLDYEQVPIHLRRGGGEQFGPAYKSINPQALVPALEDGGRILTQSLAIIEYLE